MIKRTLGGDRLGAGKKMEVELNNYGRSTHDLSYIFRSTMSAGTLVPFMCEVGLPGDQFSINLDCDVKTHPTLGPLFGSYKVQLDTFVAPIRLYQGLLHNNKLGIGMKMSDIKLPKIRLVAEAVNAAQVDLDFVDLDNLQINPSCILSYLGIRGVGITEIADIPRDLNALGVLAYWDIYKNYYSNKQEEIGYVVHTEYELTDENVDAINIDGVGLPLSTSAPASIPLVNGSVITIDKLTSAELNPNDVLINITGAQVSLGDLAFRSVENAGQAVYIYDYGTWGDNTAYSWEYTSGNNFISKPIDIVQFNLNNIDSMREYLLQETGFAEVLINDLNLPPYNYLTKDNGLVFNGIKNSQEGLGIKTYQSDLFNNWLSTEWIDGVNGISSITAVDTSDGNFTIDTLNLSKKVYDMLNRIAVSGGTYDDWLDTVYTHERYTRCETPMYMGGLIKELAFQEVVSTVSSASEGENSSSPLGTLAGKGVMTKKNKGGYVDIKIDEPSYIIGIVSLTPRIDYSQGNRWDTRLDSLDDLHKPALDEIGFQDLLIEQMAWWSTYYDGGGNWLLRSAGKQPAWVNYMTNYNRTYGNFAVKDNEMFMTLNRMYTPSNDSGIMFNIGDLTTYVDPRKYNYIFADTSLDSQNFWCQIGVDISARRKISARLMPNL